MPKKKSEIEVVESVDVQANGELDVKKAAIEVEDGVVSDVKPKVEQEETPVDPVPADVKEVFPDEEPLEKEIKPEDLKAAIENLKREQAAPEPVKEESAVVEDKPVEGTGKKKHIHETGVKADEGRKFYFGGFRNRRK